MRVAFAIDDDLHAFASAWRGPTLADGARDVDGARVAVLYREGQFQIESCVLPGGFVIPPHVHPHADTIEVGVTGAVRLTVNGVDPFATVPDEMLPRIVKGRGVRINSRDLHGGAAIAAGAHFLSFQRWIGEPQSVLTDYIGLPLGPQHRSALW